MWNEREGPGGGGGREPTGSYKDRYSAYCFCRCYRKSLCVCVWMFYVDEKVEGWLEVERMRAKSNAKTERVGGEVHKYTYLGDFRRSRCKNFQLSEIHM